MGGAYLLYAAGGTARHRHLRKLLVDACSPMLEPLSFALDNGDESFRIPCTIEMLQSIERAAEKVTNQPKAPQILDGDSVLLIGTIKPESFDPLVLGKKVDVWLQGPGFNYGTLAGPELEQLQRQHGSEQVHSITAPQCPIFTLQEWYSEIFPLYPPPLQELKAYQIGNFWLTPLAVLIRPDEGAGCASAVATDAFIRMFQLHALVSKNEIVEFHIKVLEETMAQCLGSPKLPSLQQLRAGLTSIDIGSSHEQQLQEICKVYELNKDVAEDSGILHGFTQTLMQRMPEHSSGIREYDGFVVHQMLRHLAGMKEVLDGSKEGDRQRHLGLVIECLRLAGNTAEKSPSEYVLQLRAGKRPVRLHVLHDLGLDPQNDDWIAIQILHVVW